MIFAGRAPAATLDRARFMGVDELRPGMQGYGLSVFAGSAVDTFHVEIVAVRHNYFPQTDMILARGSGSGLEKSGIAAGMSGSPIYIDGRLVGALAYGWPFMMAPIMGITPIESMLEIRDVAARPGEASNGGGAASSPDARAAWKSLLTARGDDARPYLARLAPPAGSAASTDARPIGSSLWLSGFDERAVAGLDEWLKPYGFQPVMAGGEASLGGGVEASPAGGSSPAAGASTAGAGGLNGDALVPGAAVGVQLVRGDASASAIGTVTYREGNRIIAFGHPLFQKGRTAYPMVTATIETVMPRLNDSFKFGTASNVVGTVDLDLHSGISGLIGAAPPMIPVTVKINDELASSVQTFHYEVAEDEDLTGPFIAWVTSNSLLTHGKENGDATLDIQTHLTLQDGRAVTLKDALAGNYLPGTIATEVARPIGILLGNPIEKVALKSVDVDLTVRQRLDQMTLEEVILANPAPAAGENLDILATFRNYRGETFRRRFTLPVPPDLKAGTYKLRVADAGSDQTWDAKRAPGLYDPQSVDQMLKLLGAEKPLNTLVLSLVDPRPGVSASGEELGRLPAAVLAALTSPGVEGKYDLTQGTVLVRQDQPLEGIVQGSIEMDVKVVDNPRGTGAEGTNR